MPVRVTIEAASKAEAELIAQQLPFEAQAQSWRGFGVIRLGHRSKAETSDCIESVSQSFRQHALRWARVRYGDEERIFKAALAGQSTASRSGSPNPAMR